jgi:hypothetical protein
MPQATTQKRKRTDTGTTSEDLLHHVAKSTIEAYIDVKQIKSSYMVIHQTGVTPDEAQLLVLQNLLDHFAVKVRADNWLYIVHDSQVQELEDVYEYLTHGEGQSGKFAPYNIGDIHIWVNHKLFK